MAPGFAHRPRDPNERDRQHCERRQRTGHSMFQFDARLSRNGGIVATARRSLFRPAH